MIGSLLVTYCLSLAVGAALAAPTNETACDRAFLTAQTDAYLAAQVAGKPDEFKTASAVNYTENFKAATLASGILATALPVDHNRSALDTERCASFTELISASGTAKHVIGTRIVYVGGQASQVETIVTSTGDWLFNPAGTLRYSSQEAWDPIAEDKRDKREVIQAAGDAYLDLFNNKSVAVPWGSPCARLEGGSYVQPSCDVGVPSGLDNINRRYVVDEVLGTVDILFSFGGDLPDSHEFRVEGGKIRFVHTMTVMGGQGQGH